MTFDVVYTLAMVGLVVLIGVAYSLRVWIKGRAQYNRVDKQGGSALLAKSLMEGAYWSLQPIGRLLVALRVTPNQISWASLAFSVLAGACLAVGHFGFGAGFATVSSLLDALDGMVARLTGVASDAGEVLDTTVDRYAEFFFLGGLIIYYREIPVLVVLALFALAGSFMVSYSTAKAEALQIDPPKGSMRRPERALYLTLGAALSPLTIQYWEAVREYPVPIGHPMVIALGLVAVLANLSAVERLWAVSRAVRAREAAGRAPVPAPAEEESAEPVKHLR
jgi:phosphatidylglycerophosphate synthase